MLIRRPSPRLLHVSRHTALDERAGVPEGYMIGVVAARLLVEHFPSFFAAHVAARRLTPRSLLGVAQAFFALLAKKVDIYDIQFEHLRIWDDPQALLEVSDLDDRTALTVLMDEARIAIDVPGFVVYGVLGGWYEGGETEDLESDVLALALCQLLRQTDWQVADFHPLIEALDAPLFETILGLPQLPATTPLRQLCIALDRDWTSCDPWPPLGSLLRFVFAQTGNEFADYTSNELLDMIDEGYATLNLFDVDLDIIAEDQQIARAWRAAYDALSCHVAADPTELHRLAAVIVAAADSLGECPHDDHAETTGRDRWVTTPLEAPPSAAVPAGGRAAGRAA